MQCSIVSFPVESVQGKTDHTSCSIKCYNEHRAVQANTQAARQPDSRVNKHPSEPPPVTLENPPSMDNSLKSLQPGNPFTALESSPDLQNLFVLYPNLQKQLHEVYIATLEPPPNCQESEQRNNRRFEGGSGQVRGKPYGRCRGRGNGPPWTPQRGQKLAFSRIRKFRDCEGKESDGMREFSRLVIRLHESEASLLLNSKI